MTGRVLGLCLIVAWCFAGSATAAVANQTVVLQLTGLR
jgi:hypothetical protein